MMKPTRLLVWFWCGYAAFGVLGWGLVGLIWWRTGDFWRATDSVAAMVGSFTWAVGLGIALFLLFSTAFAAALGLVVVLPIAGVVWIVSRRGR